MIPSIMDGDWVPSPIEQDQLKSMFGILINTLRENGFATYEAEMAQKELFNAVMLMTTKEGMEAIKVEETEYLYDTKETFTVASLK